MFGYGHTMGLDAVAGNLTAVAGQLRFGAEETAGDLVVRLWMSFCKWLAHNALFTIVTTLLTMWALFGDDLRVGVTEKSSDYSFDVVTVTCIVMFTMEIVVCTYGKSDYYKSFFYYLDIVATLSLILDITSVNESLFSGEGAGGVGQAGAGSARVGRVVRIIRIIRLVRIIKLYKAHLERKRKLEALEMMDPADREVFGDGGEQDEDQEESRVGKKLGEMICDPAKHGVQRGNGTRGPSVCVWGGTVSCQRGVGIRCQRGVGIRCQRVGGEWQRVARFVSTDSRFWSSQGHLVAEYASRPGIGH